MHEVYYWNLAKFQMYFLDFVLTLSPRKAEDIARNSLKVAERGRY